MIESCVTVSLVSQAKGGPFVYWDDLALACEQAALLGFDAIEIFPPSADSVPVKTLRQLLSDHNLKLAAVGSGGGWVLNKWHLCHSDARVRQQARQFITRIIDLAGDFGASAIVGSMQGRFEGDMTRVQALDWLREGLYDLGEHAKQYGKPLLYEPLNRYETNLINRASDAVEFLCSMKTEHVKILADLFHMNIEEQSIPEAIRTYGPHLGHLHFVDSNRRAAGMGHIDFAPIIQALQECNYSGFASAEAFPYPSSEEAACRTIAEFKKLFPQAASA
ncbi:MAG: sugar phosphate isomerase/epimerase [Verrucomicrobia bacterium]|nr:sugar phosphate isomerase/epimerase [Verrucomicrobiota bacterium]